MCNVVDKERVGVEMQTEGTRFIRKVLNDRFKRCPPSPRTAVIAEALLRSSEASIFNNEDQENENDKPIMKSTTAVNLSVEQTARGRGGKVINGKGSRTPAGEFPYRGRRVWTSQEDEFIRKSVEKHGTENWTLVAGYLSTQYGVSGRTGKQCWERWHNHLDPIIRKDAWTAEEEKVMTEAHKELGNKWAKISKRLPGRTDNHVKNHWYSFMRKNVRRVTREVNGTNHRRSTDQYDMDRKKKDNGDEFSSSLGPSEKLEALQAIHVDPSELPSMLATWHNERHTTTAPRSKRRKAASLAELKKYYQAAVDALEDAGHRDINANPSQNLANELSKGDRSFVEKIRAKLDAADAAKEGSNRESKIETKEIGIVKNRFDTSSTLPASKKWRRIDSRGLRHNSASGVKKRTSLKGWNGGTPKRNKWDVMLKTGSDEGLTVEVEEHGFNYVGDDVDLPTTDMNTANTDGSEELDCNDSSLNLGACILSCIRSGLSSKELPSSKETENGSFSFPHVGAGRVLQKRKVDTYEADAM